MFVWNACVKLIRFGIINPLVYKTEGNLIYGTSCMERSVCVLSGKYGASCVERSKRSSTQQRTSLFLKEGIALQPNLKLNEELVRGRVYPPPGAPAGREPVGAGVYVAWRDGAAKLLKGLGEGARLMDGRPAALAVLVD